MATVDKGLASATARPRESAAQRFFRRHGWSYAFVLPSMLTFAVFVLVPVLWAFVISFQRYSIARGGTPPFPHHPGRADSGGPLSGDRRARRELPGTDLLHLHRHLDRAERRADRCALSRSQLPRLDGARLLQAQR